MSVVTEQDLLHWQAAINVFKHFKLNETSSQLENADKFARYIQDTIRKEEKSLDNLKLFKEYMEQARLREIEHQKAWDKQ